jgi:hypothetical protein
VAATLAAGPALIEPPGAPPRVEAALPPAVAAALGAADCADVLRVYTAAAANEGGPSLLGRAECDGARVRFTPRLPFTPGLAHRAVLDLRRWGGSLQATDFTVPDRRGEAATSVSRVSPAGPAVPENLLKLYVHFSAPMRGGNVRDHVRLVDADSGAAVAAPFAEGGAELWDPGRRRLTLLLDPGRIKRGLRHQAELGAPLRAGGRYRLEIDAGLRDAAGLPLRAGFAHALEAGPADHERPDPAAWTLVPPRAGTRDALRVAFPEPLDAALLEHALRVERAGTGLAGAVEVARDQRGWSFVPAQAWAGAPHALVVDPRLEDLAGNNLRRAFDRDATREPAPPAMPGAARLSFTPRP